VSFVVVTRHRVAETAAEEGFAERGEAALHVLAQRPGFVRGRLGRATDDTSRWVLVTEWADIGSWRRALSAYEVKLQATPLLAEAVDEVSGYEVVSAVDGGPPPVTPTGRARPGK
jgi:heme-degrading monooxygenase HmoA